MRMRRHSKEGLKRGGGVSPPLSPAQRSNFLPPVAWAYPAWRARSLGWLSGRDLPLSREAALFRALARPGRGESWLDVGTSAGFYAGVLAAAGAWTLAADISPAMLAVAARRHASPRIEYALLNVEESGLPAASFDGVTVGATLNETARPYALLGECQRLLRPGGRLWLMYIARTGSPAQGALHALGGLTFPGRAQVARALPDCTLSAAADFGEVVFELFVRKP